MKIMIIALAAFLGVALSAPQGKGNDVTITRQDEQNNIGVAGYKYSYELSDGQKREETGELKNEGTENQVLVIHGSYSFTGPDGKTYLTTYTADENGYQAVAGNSPK